jgi:hypothetical protein
MSFSLRSISDRRPARDREEDTRHALTLLSEAWEEARFDGIDIESLTQAALFLVFNELVETWGEDAAHRIAESLSARVTAGEFSISPIRQ